MVKDVYTNIECKIKIYGLLSDSFTFTQEVCQGCLSSMLLCIIVAEVLASFINANKRIKGMQIGDHEIKILNFADNTTIFLRDITCLDRIQVILKLCKNVSSSKINFWKSQASGKFPLKYLKLTLLTILDNSKWDKISEGIAKNPYRTSSFKCSGVCKIPKVLGAAFIGGRFLFEGGVYIFVNVSLDIRKVLEKE